MFSFGRYFVNCTMISVFIICINWRFGVATIECSIICVKCRLILWRLQIFLQKMLKCTYGFSNYRSSQRRNWTVDIPRSVQCWLTYAESTRYRKINLRCLWIKLLVSKCGHYICRVVGNWTLLPMNSFDAYDYISKVTNWWPVFSDSTKKR